MSKRTSKTANAVTETAPAAVDPAQFIVSQADTAAGAATADQGAATGLVASDPSASGKSVAEGTNSTDDPASDSQNGSGNGAAPATGGALSNLVNALGETGPEFIIPATGTPLQLADPAQAEPQSGSDLDQDDDAVVAMLKSAKAEFVAAFPLTAAAIDAFMAKGGDQQPIGVRITSNVDGFRRAGMAHSKGTAEHPLEAFPEPRQLEQLLGERNLVVELI